MAGEVPTAAPIEPVAAPTVPVITPSAPEPAPATLQPVSTETSSGTPDLAALTAEAQSPSELGFEAPSPEAAPPAAPPTPAEAAPAEAPAQIPVTPQPITYADFTLPDGFAKEDGPFNAFTEIAGAHQIPQEEAQKLVDLYVSEAQKLRDSIFREQVQIFKETRDEWSRQRRSDPVLGGASYDTTLNSIKLARERLVPEADRDEFNQFLQVTGAGDHPAFHRLLYRAARLFNEPTAADVPSAGIRPPRDINRPPGRAGRNSLYDHPRSVPGSAR